MALSAGVYSRLKDRTTPISDKLKLSRLAWISEDIYLPNKEQVIIDTVTGFIVNKKKLQLQESDISAVWYCLDQILQSAITPERSTNRCAIFLKPSFCQAVFEVLQGWTPGNGCLSLLTSVLKCCRTIIFSATLRDVFTTRYEQLVQLFSLVLYISCLEDDTFILEVTSGLITQLSILYGRAERSNSNSKQVFELCVEKLLIPICVLRYGQKAHCRGSSLLEGVLSRSLFHREHGDIYKAYLVPVDSNKAPPPRNIARLFSILQSSLHNEGSFRDLSSELIRQSTVDCIPILFKDFVTSYKDFVVVHHPMLSWLCNQLSANPPINDEKMKCMADLFAVVQECNVYDVNKDNSQEYSQLKFYKTQLDKILDITPCSVLFECLTTLLQLNHEILEAKVKVILAIIIRSISKMASEFESSMEKFLINLVNTYVQLRQLPRLLDKLLSQINTMSDLGRNTGFPIQFLNVFGGHIPVLPLGTVLNMWNSLQNSITSHYRTSLNTDPSLAPNFGFLCQLIVVFLENVRLVDQPIPPTSHMKIEQLLNQLKDCLQKMTPIMSSKQTNFDLIFHILSLCHVWGEVMFLYKPDFTPLLQASSPLDFSLVHSYIPSDQWRRISQHILRRGEDSCKYILEKLQLQKLRCVSLLKAEDNSSLTIDSITNHVMDGLSKYQPTTEWNGNPLTLTPDVLPTAQWQLLLDYLPLLYKFLSMSQLQTLSNHLISVALSPKNDKNRCFLRIICLHDQSDLLTFLQTSFWSKFRAHLAGLSPSSPKRKPKDKAVRLSCGILDILTSDSIDWRQIGSPKHSKILLELSEGLTKILSSPLPSESTTVSALTFVQVLNTLPLEYLCEGDEVRCLAGLFTLLNLASSEFSPNSDTQTTVKISTDIINRILESHSKNPFLHFVKPAVLLSWCENLLLWGASHGEIGHAVQCQPTVVMIIRGIVRDFTLLPKLEPYINSACERMQTLKISLSKDLAFLSVVSCLLEELNKVIGWEKLTAEVKDKCFSYLNPLAISCLNLSHYITDRTGAHVAILYRCYSSLINIFSNQLPDWGSELISKFPYLITACVTYLDKQLIESLIPILGFVQTVFRRRSKLYSETSADDRDELWRKMLTILLRLLEDEGHTGQTTVMLDTRTDITQLAQTMACVLSTCPQSQFTNLINSLTQNMQACEMYSEVWRIKMVVMVWDKLLTCDLSEELMETFYQAVHNTFVQCQNLVQELSWRDNTQCCLPVVLPVLNLQVRMLEFGQVIMSGETAILGLHTYQYELLERCQNHHFTLIFSALYNILNALLIHHTDSLLAVLPTFVNVSNILLKSLLKMADQSRKVKFERSEMKEVVSEKADVSDLVQCAHQIERLFTLLTSHKVEVGKVAPYIVAGYVSEVQQVTLLPLVKKALLPAVYNLLDICDKHGLALLYTVLNPGLTETFKLIHEDYNKHFKYTGRV